jgi:hypothetical protein
LLLLSERSTSSHSSQSLVSHVELCPWLNDCFCGREYGTVLKIPCVTTFLIRKHHFSYCGIFGKPIYPEYKKRKMNKTHFVSAGGNLVVKPKSARILVNHKCSSEDELFVPSPKATSSTPSLLNMESDHGESRRCSTVDGYRSPLPRESRRSSRRISDSTNWEKTSTKQAASGNELSKSDKGAAGRRRAARDKLANSENTPKQAPTDGLSKCNHDLSRSKVLSNSNHDDSKSGHSRPRSRRDILSTSGHGRRSGQSPAHLLSNSSSHSAPESGLNQMINQQVSLLVNMCLCRLVQRYSFYSTVDANRCAASTSSTTGTAVTTTATTATSTFPASAATTTTSSGRRATPLQKKCAFE